MQNLPPRAAFRALLVALFAAIVGTTCRPEFEAQPPSGAPAPSGTPRSTRVTGAAGIASGTARGAAIASAPGASATPPSPGPGLPWKLTELPPSFAPAELQSLDWTRVIRSPAPLAAITPERLGQSWVELAFPPAPRALFWLQLDGFDPRVLPSGSHSPQTRLRLSALVPELEPLRPGVHQLTLFVTDTAGQWLCRDDGTPLFGASSFVLGEATATSGSAAPELSTAVLFTPFGTRNGSATNSLLVQIQWLHPTQAPAPQLWLSVRGPGGASLRTPVAAGSTRLDLGTGAAPLGQGDYHFSLATAAGAPAAGERARRTVTLNPELGPAEEPD